MQMNVCKDTDELGYAAAQASERILQDAVEKNGQARIVLSTGASQFAFLTHFVKMDIEWDKVEMFHLDEYVGLSEEHPASFRKYLKERFIGPVGLKQYWLVNGEGDVEANIQQLSAEISRAAIDLALIGIGENAHIAFNDPPADFETQEAYKVVDLDDACKQQQVGEGWFASIEDVPKQAITMTVRQILKSRHIISVVPGQAKAEAIKKTIQGAVDPSVPATILKTHPSWKLYLDKESSSGIYQWV